MIQFLDQLPTQTPLDNRNKVICETLYSTGIRVSELVQLNLNDLELAYDECRIHGKGNKERICIIGNPANKLLDNYIQTIRPLWHHQETDAVFINQRGYRLTPRSIQRIIKQLSQSLNAPYPITPHTIRHCFATDLYNGGADLRTIQDLLGHETISTTQIYTHLSTKKLQQTYKKTHPRA